jgi:serine protease Do
MKKIIAILLLLVLNPLISVFCLSEEELRRISSAIVLILPYIRDRRRGDEYIVASGSGTIIDKELGLVLTNFHVVADPDYWGRACEEAFIYVTISYDVPPEPAFRAKFLMGDPDRDVAILQIFEELEGSPISMDDLPSLEWENPDSWKSVEDVNPLDDVIIIGYPVYQMAIEEITINITTGKLSGFQPDEYIRDLQRAWIKTEALVSFGNSGGAALDGEGRLIGIPTQFIQDEYYGRMSRLRPVDIADPYVDEIREIIGEMGYFPDEGSDGRDRYTTFNIESLYISPIIFANQQDYDERPVNEGTRFNSNETNILYAYFDYEGMQDDLEFEFLLEYNYEIIIDEYFYWDSGSEGFFWIDLTYMGGACLPTGQYGITLYVEGYEVGYGEAEVYEGGREQGYGDVQVKGVVYDGDTGNGISGAMIGVLAPGVTISDYMADQENEELIIAYGMSDMRGNYEIEPPLERGNSYSIVVMAEGYEPLMVDDALYIDEDAPTRMRMERIYLVRY